jgi:hypothetical protein
MEPYQSDEIIQRLNELSKSLEGINDKLGLVANALLQLADKHGSTTPGPFR